MMHLNFQIENMGWDCDSFYSDDANSIAPLYAKDKYLDELCEKGKETERFFL